MPNAPDRRRFLRQLSGATAIAPATLIPGPIQTSTPPNSRARTALDLSAIAISVLQDHVGTYTEPSPGFSFTMFDGTPIQITGNTA